MHIAYVAAPYSHPDPEVVKKRMEVVSRFQAAQASKNALTISPLEKHYLLQYANIPSDYNFWGNLSRSLLRRCDSLTVIKLPGWETSTGVTDEIRIATELGLEVRYIDEEYYKKYVDDNETWPSEDRSGLVGKFYEYKYGGIYQYLCKEGKYEVCVKHVWPFEEKVFIKNAKEWLAFSKPLTDEEVKLRMSGDREVEQAKVMALKYP